MIEFSKKIIDYILIYIYIYIYIYLIIYKTTLHIYSIGIRKKLALEKIIY